MSDIFENDIDSDNDLSGLEDNDTSYESSSAEHYVFNEPLYRLKLEYSCEGLYANVDNDSLVLNPGDKVIVPTRYGKDLAIVLGKATTPVGIKPDDVVIIDRKATKEDLKKAENFKQKEVDAFKVFKEKVEYHKLDMKLISVHFLIDEQKALFFFSADNRVDFRELVKDLVSVFKMRIELRQVGVRDESRITGGLGVCGRPYCCHAVSDKLRPVSIRMAKDQNLSLNSMKISGQCGRLLCCLSYEFDFYAEARKKLPSEGIHIFYDGTNFRITEINPLKSMIKMLGDDGRLIEVNASRFVKENGKWKIN
ncbi:stage 0 sporulation family protein [Treponema sp.]|uniref:PSP1 domain-containing protein n=1 Tax=Treponema sp. TaxID=166 RepID=UPI00388EFA2F